MATGLFPLPPLQQVKVSIRTRDHGQNAEKTEQNKFMSLSIMVVMRTTFQTKLFVTASSPSAAIARGCLVAGPYIPINSISIRHELCAFCRHSVSHFLVLPMRSLR